MNNKMLYSILVLAVFMLPLTSSSRTQEKTVKKTPIAQTSPTSGEEMFKAYCSVCHGKDAKGRGPTSEALKTAPPDLTTLAKRHDGRFPEDYVSNVLRSGVKAPAHGSSDMPIWGPLFSSISSSDQAIVNMRIANLVHYLESLQAK
jgi:mono/diheme cytochrome c family protein